MIKNIGCIIMLFLISCGNQQQTGQTVSEQLKILQSLTGNANWQLTDGADTSYIFFSRLANGTYLVYSYKTDAGDTTHNRLSKIAIHADSIMWNLDDKVLSLENADTLNATWNDKSGQQYIMHKNADDQLDFIEPGNRKIVMKKTLPIATFLARIRYDYQHGTSFTFDSGEVKSREPEKMDSVKNK